MLNSREHFDSLYGDYRGKVYRVILRMVRNPSDAEDLTQETFLKVNRNLPHVKRPESVPSWLYRIATNTALDHLRQASSHDGKGIIQLSLEDVEPTPTDTPSPPASLDSTESVSCVHEYADRMPEQYRVALVLHDLEGLPLAQVAEVMGSSVGATKVRLHRARKRFAEICVAECEQFLDKVGWDLQQDAGVIRDRAWIHRIDLTRTWDSVAALEQDAEFLAGLKGFRDPRQKKMIAWLSGARNWAEPIVTHMQRPPALYCGLVVVQDWIR